MDHQLQATCHLPLAAHNLPQTPATTQDQHVPSGMKTRNAASIHVLSVIQPLNAA